MVVRKPFASVCPCCSARYAFPRPQPRRAVVPLSRRPTARSAASRIASFRPFATVIHDDEFQKHVHTRQEPEHDPREHPRGHSHHRRRPREPHHSHAWPASSSPTPYEIFGQAKGAPYQKARFYDLAKLYHPDLHHSVPSHLQGLSTAVLLERYRLIVAANDILSHPGRRRMYDLYGVGWQHPDAAPREQARAADRAWRQRPGNAAGNATWEDWERWREANGGGGSDGSGSNGAKQEEQFMSNGGFAVMVLVFVFLGGWGQLTRAESHGTSILAMQEHQNQAISQMLRQQQSASAPLSRQDRVGSFLERREGWDYELSAAARAGGVSGSSVK